MVRNFGGQPRRARIFPQTLPAHCIKVLGQIDESYEWAHVLFPALLLDLAEYEDHVCCASVGPEATLALWCVLFGNGGNQPVKHEVRQDLDSYGEESIASVI